MHGCMHVGMYVCMHVCMHGHAHELHICANSFYLLLRMTIIEIIVEAIVAINAIIPKVQLSCKQQVKSSAP